MFVFEEEIFISSNMNSFVDYSVIFQYFTKHRLALNN